MSFLDVFRLDAKAMPFEDQVFLTLLDTILHRTLFHIFNTLGSHLREEGSLDYDGVFVCLLIQKTLIRI
jgi:hypothetical protein